MRRTPFVVALIVCAIVGFAPLGAAAQDATRPVVLNVTMSAAGDLLTIHGVGFGTSPAVTIDGQPVSVLPNGTDTDVTVVTPAILLTNPGTYRITIVDSTRQLGETFVAASQGRLIETVSAGAGTSASAGTTASAILVHGTGSATSNGDTSTRAPGIFAVEDPASPYTTALGYHALFQNTSNGVNPGLGNTGIGYQAIFTNSQGSANTAVGYQALYLNIGDHNTAIGAGAGFGAQSGSYNLYLASDTTDAFEMNTTRIGLPYVNDGVNPPSGQNRTFIAGIRGTTVGGGFPVVIDSNGQLGTADGSGNFGIGTDSPAAKLDVRVTGTLPPAMKLINGDAGGGQLVFNVAGAPFNNLLAGDAMISNGVGHLVLSPNASGKDVRFIGGQWTNPITMAVTDGALLGGGGAVGIGTTSPLAKLDVRVSGIAPPSFRVVNTNAGGGVFGINTIGGAVGSLVAGDALMQNGVGNIVFSPNAAGKDVRFIGGLWTNPISLVIKDGGNVGIGTLNPTNPLQMGSGAYVSAGGVWTNASSRTFKDHIVELPTDRALEAFAQLKPVTFTYKVSGEAHVGFIAEDVPELVATADRKSLAAMDIVAVLTKVVQDQRAQLRVQQEQLQTQQQQLQAQQATDADLHARLARLEALVSQASARGAR